MEDKAHKALVCQSLALVLAALCTLVRAYVKVFIVKRVRLDDWLVFAAMALYVTYASMIIDSVTRGSLGEPTLHPEPRRASLAMFDWYLSSLVYPPVTLLTRASLCVFLLRLAAAPWHQAVVWATLALASLFSAFMFIILAAQCNPPSLMWSPLQWEDGGNDGSSTSARSVSGGSCIDGRISVTAVWIYSLISALADWCLGLLPVFILRKSGLDTRSMTSIAFLLSLGIFAGVVIIIRLPYIENNSNLPRLYKLGDIVFWSALEPALGIMAVCAASFRPLFKTWALGRGITLYPNTGARSGGGQGGEGGVRNSAHHNHPHERLSSEPGDSAAGSAAGEGRLVGPKGGIQLRRFPISASARAERHGQAGQGEQLAPNDSHV